MKQRVITGVLGASGFLILLWLGNWWYSGLLLFLATFAFLEYAQMNRLSWRRTPVILGIGLVWFIFVTQLPQLDAISSDPLLHDPNQLLLGLVFFLVLIVLSRNHFDIFQVAYLFIGSIYIGYGFSYMMLTIWKQNGLALTLLVIFITWANDSAAYFIGKRFGKRKLWPEISPNKTIEGSMAGIVFGVIMSVLIFLIFPALGNLLKAIWLGLLISVVGQIGDLIESAWKRTTGVKDSGTILPGHGGVLDRFDSLLFTFIVLHLVRLV
ncbi:phosphatidate cytidylyltransferase [Paenactinomyces guangxiensis]|uniref:Phosphatidate cytidylyltransferase n=1 Tax=Paenactinomyces guangxiensis TaxID=1490290 RepID=A0A7W2A9Z0_9BACL|nr:phosphatidate cytidylyltransferase [Paenactinomyces guangxiensis]MBA4496235.1 phosphatidate cytidylyltransferase [Paenactinomyces guangxiensis]MBH8593383.1 phosphatidate cytidylyltransferase [Paenactinomyces guangxiensis]